MASGVVVDLPKIPNAPDITGADWVNLGVKAGTSVAMFVLQQKNRNMLRKNINNNIKSLDTSISNAKNNLLEQKQYVASEAKARIQQALNKHQNDLKKMQTMLMILDTFDKKPIDVEKIATAVGVSITIIVLAYVAYIVIKKRIKK